jgi:hypothetical protein
LRRLTRPARPPPKGLFSAKSMCFCESVRTMKDGTFTICLPTLQATLRVSGRRRRGKRRHDAFETAAGASSGAGRHAARTGCGAGGSARARGAWTWPGPA